MKTASRPSRLAAGIAVGAIGLLLLAVAGCGDRQSSGEDHDHDEDHAGHVIPAHKPKSFPDAVRRLRELNDQFARSSPGGETLDIALDIANWLPEIAADSDMPPAPWDEVNARSAAIVSDYRAIIAGAAADETGRRVRDAGEAISGLEKVLAAADPEWFAAREKPREGPGASPADAPPK